MIRAYLVDDFTINKWNGADKWGNPNAYSQIPIKGKIIYKTKLIRDMKGEEVVSSAMIYFSKTDVDVLLNRVMKHEDRIQISGESYDHSILRIDVPKAFSNPHYEIYIA